MTSHAVAPVERSTQRAFAIRVEKEHLKFSAAHFLIFEDGTAERLHGHNYRVAVELEAAALEHGVIVDFNVVKRQLATILERLDERFLVPGRNDRLTWEERDGELTVRFGARRYVVPVDEVVVLPITNSSSEELAEFLATELLRGLREAAPTARWSRVEVGVEETSGQRGLCILRP
jgi:6-pyruvoyltetrahydropterin/6-carboxytetrahydropterin synthase